MTPTGCQFVVSLQVHMYDNSEMCHSAQLLQYLQLSLFNQFDDHLSFFVTYLFIYFFTNNPTYPALLSDKCLLNRLECAFRYKDC